MNTSHFSIPPEEINVIYLSIRAFKEIHYSMSLFRKLPFVLIDLAHFSLKASAKET